MEREDQAREKKKKRPSIIISPKVRPLSCNYYFFQLSFLVDKEILMRTHLLKWGKARFWSMPRIQNLNFLVVWSCIDLIRALIFISLFFVGDWGGERDHQLFSSKPFCNFLKISLWFCFSILLLLPFKLDLVNCLIYSNLTFWCCGLLLMN